MIAHDLLSVETRERNQQSWDAMLALFQESYTHQQDGSLQPIIDLIEIAKSRGWNQTHHASQSHLRFAIMKEERWPPRSYLMLSCSRDGPLLCQAFNCIGDEHIPLDESRCSLAEAVEFIESHLPLLDR